MRACWLKWVGRDWSISADYIWLNYSDANKCDNDTRLVLECEGYYPVVNAKPRCITVAIYYAHWL